LEEYANICTDIMNFSLECKYFHCIYLTNWSFLHSC